MPEICRFLGIVISMNYNDHAPPHLHARCGGDKAMLDIRTLRVIDGRLPPRVLGLVVECGLLRAAANAWRIGSSHGGWHH